MIPAMASHPFRTAVEARDRAAMLDALAPDVVLHSPITFKPFEGREAVGVVLGVVFGVFEDFRYTDELAGVGGSDVHGLVFRARIGDREVEGIDLLRDDEDGKVSDFTVMVRPLSAALALRDAVAKGLSAASA
jgi:hypothetical protein